MSTGMTAMATLAGATLRLMKRPLQATRAKQMQVTKTNIRKESGMRCRDREIRMKLKPTARIRKCLKAT